MEIKKLSKRGSKSLLVIALIHLFSFSGISEYSAFADATEVTKVAITKVDVGYKKITFSLNPATFNSAFVRDYEIGFKGHYDTEDYGDPSSYCNIPTGTNIVSKKTVISCVVDLSGISKDVTSQFTAKGVTIDWVIRGTIDGNTGVWSDPYSLQLFNFPAFLKAPSKSSTSSKSWPNGAIARCRDGSYSFQAQHRGACSRHGGVALWKTP